MIDPIEAYEHGLCCGEGRAEWADGTVWELPIRSWSSEPDRGDLELLNRCHGPTLDVGCGPGRLTAELSRRGLPALGVDISELAVALTRARGGSAMQHDVFSTMLGSRRWRHIVLADGNVGIGGDPLRMLWRCRELLHRNGSVLVDLEPPGIGLRCGRLRMLDGADRSGWFGWAWLGVDVLEPVAAAAGLRPVGVWPVTGSAPRWQAELVRSDEWPT